MANKNEDTQIINANKPTANDIAEYLGISRGTVSRALNDRERISPETKAKVLEMAQKLGYKPNKAARALVKNEVQKVAICTFSEPKYFWKLVKDGIKRAYNDLKDFGFEIEIIENDIKNPDEQIEQLRRISETGAGAVALAPNDPQIMDSIVDELIEKDIPVVVFNADIPTSSRICYVGCNYFKDGRLAGHLLGSLLNGAGKVAVLTFSEVIITIQQRIMGFNETISEYPCIEVLPVCRLKRSGEGAYEYTRDMLVKNPGLSGIYVSFGILEEVARAVVDAGMKGKVKIVGYDLSEETERYIKEGVIESVICHEPVFMGYFIVKLLYNIAVEKKKPVKRFINTKLEIVMKENLNYYTDEGERFDILNI